MKATKLAMLLLVLPALWTAAHATDLDCQTGPVTKEYGGSKWLVYACNDGHSLSLVSAPGSKALPFVFVFHWEAGQYQLSGAGTGNKVATDAAFKDIGTFTGADILALLSEVQAAAHH